MGAVQVIDDVLWTLGLESLVAKARPPSPLTPRGFTRLTRALVAAISNAVDGFYESAMVAVVAELQRRWTVLTEEQRSEVFTQVYRTYTQRVLQGIERLTSVFGQHATTIISTTRAASGTQFSLPFNDTFNALDLEVARHLRSSQALFVRGANGRVAEALSARAREVVARGLERGFDSQDISVELARELRGEEGRRRRDYHRMLSEVFVGRARTYGVLRSFEAAGITRYEHRAVLDEVTCNVCRFMHGRSFEVRVSLGQYQQVADSPAEEVANIQPFLRTFRGPNGSTSIGVRTAEGVTNIADVLESGVGRVDATGSFRSRMSDDRIQRLGCGCSPFHPYCRCTQVPVSTSTVQVPGEVQTFEPAAPTVVATTPAAAPTPAPQPRQRQRRAPATPPAPTFNGPPGPYEVRLDAKGRPIIGPPPAFYADADEALADWRRKFASVTVSKETLVSVFGSPDRIPTLTELAKAWSPDGDFKFIRASAVSNGFMLEGYPRAAATASNPYPSQNWSQGTVNRSFKRDKRGLIVHHDYQVLKPARTDPSDESAPLKGMGTRAVRNSMALYSHLGADAIEVHAAWSGKFAWPNMGFDWMAAKKPKDLEQRLTSFLTRHGVPEPAETAAMAAKTPWGIARLDNGTVHTRSNRIQGGTLDLSIGKLFLFEEASNDLLYLQLNLKKASSESFKRAESVVLQPRKP